ncbi:ABC transporter permease subunit [Neobacillus drentensis]|jgi:peptide/nickel transport system permease protein|uniref:ABC transporter permease subunit n=1 Tax=Neobacillus drentensis TaxID=220684 RepID=UPI0030004364
MTKDNRSKWILYSIFTFLFLLFIASFFLEFGVNQSIEPGKLIYSSDGKVLRPPLPSSLEHPLGTDKNGNDLLTKLIIGFKYTFIISIVVTLIRMLIGIFCSLSVLYFLRPLKAYIESLLTPFLYVPAFILFFLLASEEEIIINKYGSHFFTFYQVLIIVLIGTPPLIELLIKEFELLLNKEYVIASRLLGASKLHISIRQIFPVFKQRFYIVFLQQTIATIILLTHLGVFQVFIGGKAKGGIIGEEDDRFLSQSGEWGGMIGQSIFDMVHYPWLLIYPACAVVGLILLLNIIIKRLDRNQR